jgi:hypothetical protein
MTIFHTIYMCCCLERTYSINHQSSRKGNNKNIEFSYKNLCFIFLLTSVVCCFGDCVCVVDDWLMIKVRQMHRSQKNWSTQLRFRILCCQRHRQLFFDRFLFHCS